MVDCSLRYSSYYTERHNRQLSGRLGPVGYTADFAADSKQKAVFSLNTDCSSFPIRAPISVVFMRKYCLKTFVSRLRTLKLERGESRDGALWEFPSKENLVDEDDCFHSKQTLILIYNRGENYYKIEQVEHRTLIPKNREYLCAGAMLYSHPDWERSSEWTVSFDLRCICSKHDIPDSRLLGSNLHTD